MPLSSCQQSQVPAIVSSVVKTTTSTTATGNENRVQLAGEVLSHTTVSSSEIIKSEPDKTLAPVENYNAFAVRLLSWLYSSIIGRLYSSTTYFLTETADGCEETF